MRCMKMLLCSMEMLVLPLASFHKVNIVVLT